MTPCHQDGGHRRPPGRHGDRLVRDPLVDSMHPHQHDAFAGTGCPADWSQEQKTSRRSRATAFTAPSPARRTSRSSTTSATPRNPAAPSATSSERSRTNAADGSTHVGIAGEAVSRFAGHRRCRLPIEYDPQPRSTRAHRRLPMRARCGWPSGCGSATGRCSWPPACTARWRRRESVAPAGRRETGEPRTGHQLL
jgi:hypothetical protein